MIDGQDSASAFEQSRPASDRLESWKEIAAHLRRDVRTVQRWEQTDGLPVHRFRRAHRAIPYAFKSEIDTWWTERSAEITVHPEVDPDPKIDGHLKRTRSVVLATAATALFLALATAYWIARPHASRVVPLTERTWVLVAGFENHSGDPTVDDVVEPALSRNLSQSPVLAIVARPRVNDALHLMRRPADTKLDAATAVQVCSRDQAIAAMVSGRVDKLSAAYVLTANVSAPCTSAPIAVLVEQSASRGLADAVARLSDRIRAQLGEHGRPSRATDSLARVTTPSLTALRLFTQADTLLVQGGEDAGAESLLREAIADDPDFASAHILLAWAIARQRRPPADYLPVAAHAEQLAEASTESERLFIRGSALEFRGQNKQACAHYAAVLRIQPDHYWAANNVVNCTAEGGGVTVAESWANLADLHPNSLRDNVMAAWANEFLIESPARARRYRDRAEQLQRDGQYTRDIYADSWLRIRPAYRRWLDDDIDGALNALVTTVSLVDGRLEPLPSEDLFEFAGGLTLTLGRPSDAERIYNRMADPGPRPGYLALADYARDDTEHARKHEDLYSNPGPMAAIVSARIGLLDRARATLAGERVEPGTWNAEAIEGELAFQSGDLPAAIEHLAVAVRRPQGQPHYFLAAETLAEALAQSSRLDEAIETLETASAQRQHAYDPGYGGPIAGYTWLRVRVLQGELYARRSRTADSERVARELVRLLRRADPNFPLLRRAMLLLHDESASSRRDSLASRPIK
jgi:tetratricopeptide (TPR) repeat protein